jgi:L-threonylcarbamoyladenylate synthase
METLMLSGNDTEKAAEIITSGGLCGVPTETVYGLAANGFDENAVREIYNVKGRPETKALSLLVSCPEDMKALCVDIPEAAWKLARKFWPGAMTIVLKKSARVPDFVTAGMDTVGVRCPDHPVTLDIIRRAGVPLAAPSANISGEKSPKSASDVLSYFDGKIDAVVDGGACSVGIESTIVDLTGAEPKILRHGGIPDEEIFKAVAE